MLESHILPMISHDRQINARGRLESAMLDDRPEGSPAAVKGTSGSTGILIDQSLAAPAGAVVFELGPPLALVPSLAKGTPNEDNSAPSPALDASIPSSSSYSPPGPSPADSPTSSPSSSHQYFSFSPALSSSRYRSDSGASGSSYWADAGRVGPGTGSGNGGRNRSFSVATMATSLGCWDERDLGGEGEEKEDKAEEGNAQDGHQVDVMDTIGSQACGSDAKGKARLVEGGGLLDQDAEDCRGDATSRTQEEATPRPPLVMLVSTNAAEETSLGATSGTHLRSASPAPTANRPISSARHRAGSVDAFAPHSRSGAASPIPPSPLLAPAPRSARSRAGSIARSLAGLSSGARSGSVSPSPASSIRSFGGTSAGPSATGMLRSKMKRSRSSLLNILGGNGSGSGRADDSRVNRQDDPDVEEHTPLDRHSPDPAQDTPRKGKGRVKGLVKRYISRTQSAVTVPVVASPATTPFTAPSHSSSGHTNGLVGNVDLDIVNAGIRRALSDRVVARPRSKSLDGPTLLLQTQRELPLLPADGQQANLNSGPSSGSPEIRSPQVDYSPQGAQKPIVAETAEPGVNYFDSVLPKELKVTILRTLIDEHIRDHECEVEEGIYKGQRAKNQRWYGESAGRREVVKLSRVSRSWRSLAFDGQLWARADLHPYMHSASPTAMSDLLRHVSRFLIQLDLHGWSSIPDVALRRALVPATEHLKVQKLDLRFCNQISDFTLAGLLGSAPELRHANLRGLTAVDWSLVQALNASCPRLEHLDISFCRGAGILDMDDFSTSGEWRYLKTLKVAGGMFGRGVLRNLASTLPKLETLDLSYSPAITDDELLDLVRVDKDPALETYDLLDSLILPIEVVRLRPSQAGLPVNMAGGSGLICRRVLNLRHLVLTRCPRITDQGLHYLAHAVPRLELLELAGIGVHLRDNGIIALLDTTPLIRKIDLESAIEITDKVIQTLTPPRHAAHVNEIHTGTKLESLSLGYASGITTDAIMRLIRCCPRLRHLGLDNTGVSDVVVKEFVRRKTNATSISVVDCRHISRNVVEALERQTRPRRGWRGWQATPFHYQDGVRPRTGRDECVELPVVQSFWTWSKVPRTPASLAMSGESKVRIQDFDEGEIDQVILRGEERSCVIM